jgi:hypothetical protein
VSNSHVLQILFLSVFILQVVMHGEDSQVPGDLRQSEILIEQDFKIWYVKDVSLTPSYVHLQIPTYAYIVRGIQ